jgi:hypothetical protein
MDEEDFPVNSVDEENIASFYDQYCEVEDPEDVSINIVIKLLIYF